jgi:hypothetical protein
VRLTNARLGFHSSRMDPGVSSIERAFQLAATVRYDTVSEVKIQLAREGYRERQIEGRVLLKQIADVIKQAGHLK